MAVEILMPKLGLTMTTGTVIKWLKNVGDSVYKDEPVMEIETEKLTYMVEAPAEGIILKRVGAEGEKYPIAFVLGYIGKPGEEVGGSDSGEVAAQPAAAVATDRSFSVELDSFAAKERSYAEKGSGKRVIISPVAKKMAANLGIDYRQIKGTGPSGRIVKADVLAFSEAAARTPGFSSVQIPADKIIPYSGMRRAIGETMRKALETIPMVTHQVSADASALVEFRGMVNSGVEDKGEKVTVGELMLKLTAAALSAMPILNSSFTEEGIRVHGAINLGMATALEDGLIVPVIHSADRKGLLAVSKEAKAIAAKAKAGELSHEQVSGGTFTVTNLGSFGSVDFFTPIINPPQAAILGIGRIADTVSAVGGEVKIVPMMGLSLTYDHRIIDGAVAAQFLKLLMKLMENPARALL